MQKIKISAKDVVTENEKQLAKEVEQKDKEIALLHQQIDLFSRQERKYKIPTAEKYHIKFAAIGDTHIGSLYERSDALREFYSLCEKENVELVLHAGDLLDGHGMYKGHDMELYALGFERQKRAFLERTPTSKIPTYFICGNHDASFKKIAGVNVGKAIEQEKENWFHKGDDYANIYLKTKAGGEFHVQLLHPDGGTAYAISYKSQKIVESYSGGEKPHMVLIGHYHKAEFMPSYRNVMCFQVGCFQSQTPYMQRKPTPAHLGGWIMDVWFNPKTLAQRVRPEFIPFYEPKTK